MSNDGDEENINNKEETVDEGTASNIKVATTNTKLAKSNWRGNEKSQWFQSWKGHHSLALEFSTYAFEPTVTMMCLLLYVGILMHILSAVAQHICAWHFFQKSLLTSPGSKQY